MSRRLPLHFPVKHSVLQSRSDEETQFMSEVIFLELQLGDAGLEISCNNHSKYSIEYNDFLWSEIIESRNGTEK